MLKITLTDPEIGERISFELGTDPVRDPVKIHASAQELDISWSEFVSMCRIVSSIQESES